MRAGRVYPVKDDIPVMLVDEATIERSADRTESLKILLVRLRLIGDVVFTTPVIRALRRRFPAAEISYLVEPAAAPVVEHNPHLNHVIVVPHTRGWQRIKRRRCAWASRCARRSSTSASTCTVGREAPG